MTNKQLAELRDPERRQAGWWAKQIPNSCPHCNRPLNGTHVTPPAEDLIGGYRCLSCRVMHTSEFTFTGPDWHASDDACFRDWRPVLLAAGCHIEEHVERTAVYDAAGNPIAYSEKQTYRAAILAAVAWLAEHKPELLREAIAQVVEGK